MLQSPPPIQKPEFPPLSNAISLLPTGADPGYILTTAQSRLSEILGCGSLDAGVAL